MSTLDNSMTFICIGTIQTLITMNYRMCLKKFGYRLWYSMWHTIMMLFTCHVAIEEGKDMKNGFLWLLHVLL